MLPGASPKPRHITAATHVLSTRLTHNTAERVTIGNTPLHVLHLCDAQYLAPRFASCTSVTALTVHLKYVASSSALAALLSAAAKAVSLREVTVMGGVSAMEAAAMADGLAAFAWPVNDAGAPQGSGSTASAASPNTAWHTVQEKPVSGRAHPPDIRRTSSTGGGDAARRRAFPITTRPSAEAPAHGTPPAAAHSRRPSSPFADHCVSGAKPFFPTPPEAPLRAPQWRLRAGGLMWPVHSGVSPRSGAGVYRPMSPPSSPLASRGVLQRMRGTVALTLELHRLEEATADVVLSGLRRATRVTTADVRLCVSNAEARRAGVRLAQEAKRLAAHHRQRRAVCAPPSPRTPPDALSGGSRHPRRGGGDGGVPSPYASPLPRASAPHPHRTLAVHAEAQPSPGVAPSSRRPTSTAATADRRGPREITHSEVIRGRQRPTPIASPPLSQSHGRVAGTPCLPPRTPPVPDAAAPRPHARLPRTADVSVSTQGVTDVFRCRGRHPSPVSSPTRRELPGPLRRSAQGGRLYSPPRWNVRRPVAGVRPPDGGSPGVQATAVVVTEAGRRAQHSAASFSGQPSPGSRPEVFASDLSSSTWSSRSSSPPPRRPPSPLLRRADVAFARLVAYARAAAAGSGGASTSGAHGTRQLSPRTPPPPDTGRQLLRLRCRGRTRATDPTGFPTASPHTAAPSALCSPQYCLRRGSDELRVCAAASGASRRLPGPSARVALCGRSRASLRLCPSPPSRCSCYFCRSHPSSRSPATSPAARASHLRPPPPSPYTATSVPSSLTASPPAAARSTRSPLARVAAARVTRPATQNGACGTPRGDSAAASLNGITPPRRRRSHGSSGGGVDGRTASSSSPAPSRRRASGSTSCSSSSTHRARFHDKPDNGLVGVSRQASHGAHLRASHTQLPSPTAPQCKKADNDDDVGFVVYPSSVAFLRARVREINQHVVWHQVQSAKAAEEHARRLEALEVTFSDRVTGELTDIMMVLTDMEHGSRVGERA